MWYRKAKQMVRASQKNDGRIFIATWLPEEARQMFDHIEDLNDDLHITFLYVTEGVNGEAKQRQALKAVAEVCARTAPLRCDLAQMGVMDNEDRALVANVDIEGGARFHADLVDAIEAKLGETKRDYDFIPHVTLSSCSDGKADVKDLPDYSWTTNEITVQFGPEGSQRYRIPLKGDE